jgi:hypothetical protein
MSPFESSPTPTHVVDVEDPPFVCQVNIQGCWRTVFDWQTAAPHRFATREDAEKFRIPQLWALWERHLNDDQPVETRGFHEDDDDVDDEEPI